MEPQRKRVNVFTNDSAELDKRPKRNIPIDTPLCTRHNRYCGPNHERFWIAEEGRWMTSWEEYKYVGSKDYYVDSPVYFCASSHERRCVLCLKWLDEHDAMRRRDDDERVSFLCRGKVLRKWHNQYTHMIAGMPEIIDLSELENDRFTQ